MTADEALTILRRWRSRDEEANLAVRAVLDRYGYDSLAELHLHDPELVVIMHDNLAPLIGMEAEFVAVDAAQREGLREVTGRNCTDCDGYGYHGPEVEENGIMVRQLERPCETCRRLIPDV